MDPSQHLAFAAQSTERHDAMKARWQARREASAVSEEESSEKFWCDFGADRSAVIAELNRFETFENKADAVSDLEKRVRLLTESITPAAAWLSAFDVKRATREAKEVEDKVASLKKQILPRKKFGFSKRSTTKSDSEKRQAHKETSYLKKPNILQDLCSERAGFFCQKNAVLCWQEEAQRQVHLEDLEDCIVLIPCDLAGLRMRRLTRCHVFARCVEGPVYVQNLKQSQLRFCSRQLRIHDTSHTDFYVQTATGPIIEDCQALRFAKYATSWTSWLPRPTPTLPLQPEAWSQVSDFKWLRPEASPNWSLLPDDSYCLHLPPKAASDADRFGLKLLPAADSNLPTDLTT